MLRLKFFALGAAALLALGACGNTESADEPEDSTTIAAEDSEGNSPDSTMAPEADPVAAGWEEHVVDPETGCMCSDGSEFSFWSRDKNPDKVMFYFQGGGACFSEETCDPVDGSYKVTAAVDGTPGGGEGIFDFENADNPLADWSVVFVPYCTGDVHIGNATYEYSDTLSINHVGYLNGSKAMEYLLENFGDASEVLVTGSSAGGVPAPLFAGLLGDEMPDAQISALADASGAYSDNPPINQAIGTLWGTFNNVPDWSVNEGLEPQDWSIPGLFVQTALHNPDIRMARFDNAYDETQEQFSSMSGLSDGDLKDLIVANERQIEAESAPVASYIAPGDAHTVLGRNTVYSMNVEGVSFLEWLTDFIEGEDVPDIICTDCVGE